MTEAGSMREPMSDLDRLVERILEARTVGYISLATRKTLRDAEDTLRLQDATITRLREALAELLSGHDNLYVAYWGPHADPRNDIATKAARQALGGEHG